MSCRDVAGVLHRMPLGIALVDMRTSLECNFLMMERASLYGVHGLMLCASVCLNPCTRLCSGASVSSGPSGLEIRWHSGHPADCGVLASQGIPRRNRDNA